MKQQSSAPQAWVIPGIVIDEARVREIILKRFENVEEEKLNHPIRTREYVLCRQLIMAYTYMVNNKESLHKIGYKFLRDHGTVLYAFSTLAGLYDTCNKTRRMMDQLKAECKIEEEKWNEWITRARKLSIRNQ